MEIAVLLATFNRKEKTLSCLNSLFNQDIKTQLNLSVYLTDDNSSDGTAQEVNAKFPSVHVFNGNGSLFWAGGMRNSWGHACKSNADYFLLLNDDTLLKQNCLMDLLAYFKKNEEDAIIVGSTSDQLTGKISYGGHKLYHPKKVPCYNVFSETEYLECDMANANIMLVPRNIVNQIGILSSSFTHSIADFDYTLRAKKAGYKTIVAPGILGYCIDDNLNEEKRNNRNLRQRIAHLKSPKGLAYKEYMGFISTHFPSHKLKVMLKIWLKTLLPSLWLKLKKNKI